MDDTKQPGSAMEMRLEVVPIPVSDVDAAKDFYTRQVGFNLDHDVSPGNGMRVVQMTPPGFGMLRRDRRGPATG